MTHMQRIHALLAMVLAPMYLWVALAFPVEARTRLDLPSPLAGPGVPETKKSQRKKIERGWRELAAGDLVASLKRAERAGQAAPARLLRYQIQLTAGEIDTTQELASYCEQHPDYAAAWMTLSVAAEDAGLETRALEAARHGAQLWTTPPWGNRAITLEQRWIDDRVVNALQLFETGNSGAALAELEAAMALDPHRSDAVLLEAKIFFSNNQLTKAEDRLQSISELPDAVMLHGLIADKRGNWQSAMESYSSLPDDYPGRALALERAKTRWRMTLLPRYAQAAMVTEELTRGDLAVVLVSVQPRLETMLGGAVPVMSDIVDHPGQREIITVVRLGIMNADRRGHLFYPESVADVETVREAVQRSRAVLGLSAPLWCAESDVVGSTCHSIPSPPSGENVANAVLDPMSGAIHE